MTDLENDLLRRSASEQLGMLSRGELSSVELLAETQSRFDAVNPVINAVVSEDFAAAKRLAAESDRRRSAGEPPRPLEGLPVAVKDLEETQGMRSTYGSLLHRNHVPEADSLVVERLRNAGAVIYGKTNTPEFGTGSHTYNQVFGTTTNPYDPARSAGGSSGGAAAALAAGLSSVADGSDMGGSLRNPAAFCNVVGLRPSIGRVPNWPAKNAWDTLATNGPMGRTVEDVGILLSALSGADPRTPLAFPEPFVASRHDDSKLRIGWSRSLGGLPIDPRISEVLEREGLPTLEALGHRLLDREPNMDGADESFRVLRGLNYAQGFGALLAQHRETLSPELVANTEYGLGLGIADIFTARDQRTQVYERLRTLFTEIDVLAAPVTMALPFPAEQHWPAEVAGIPQADYLDWMRASWRISLTGFASLSLPCGFSPEGLPVGLHLIAPPRQEAVILRLAAEFERVRPVWRIAPSLLAGLGTAPKRQQAGMEKS